MSEFYNPYQFIPLNDAPSGLAHKQEIGKKATTARHDYWGTETYSGRIICKLVTKTPVAIAAKHTKGNSSQPGQATLYTNPMTINSEKHDWPAIPATSLRGMVSAVAEAISDSPMRVFDNRHYSVRKPPQKALSAVGLLRKVRTKKNGDFQWELLPLSLPTMHAKKEKESRGYLHFFGMDRKLSECMKIYLGKDPVRTTSTCTDADQLKNEQDKGEFTVQCAINSNVTLKSLMNNYQQYFADNGTDLKKKGQYIIGQNFSKSYGSPLTSGLFRSTAFNFGKHDWFIPLTKETIENQQYWHPISSDVINKLERMLLEAIPKDQSKNTNLLPKGYNIKPDQNGDIELIDGSIVLFDINSEGQVNELSYSQIWRKELNDTAKDFFPSGYISEDNGVALSPVDAIFGTVRDQVGVMGRVRFSVAQSNVKPDVIVDVTLKKLDSPKPPCPAMYFQSSQKQLTQKHELSKTHNTANGRKVYLHHNMNAQGIFENQKKPWDAGKENGKQTQHLNTDLISQDQAFYYHVDFDNLSAAELTLLKIALDPNSSTEGQTMGQDVKSPYYHKIGLGKPLGLGSVQNAILFTLFIDRDARYSINGLNASRYHWAEKPSGKLKGVQEQYLSEWEALNQLEKRPPIFDDQYICAQQWQAQCIVGCADYDRSIGVKYPANSDSGEENFKWFVTNASRETRSPQQIKPITQNGPTAMRPYRSKGA
ncbi:hypothetical protein VA249_12260 [Vibrio alfacsensis]|uniref:TIGR03986 family type III CRISPR-associated RAMP protein n=1 Tax=Vibrio alfacsensis TaxID=1074311 RepID=UPI001BED5F5A|nr:TIGR03986 family CRISPR-associated RAMP protein [Vibrio alfacsensis]BBM64580.1 hypothetical protein VA249_12260 [Vibrio alfacsensis]